MTSTQLNTSGSLSVPTVLIAIIAFIFPLVNMIYIFYPLNFMGKNIWLVIPVLVILVLYLSTLANLREGITVKKSDVFFLVIMVVGGFIFYLRELLYAEQRSFLDIRYIFSPIIFLLVSMRLIKGEKQIHFLSGVLIATCFIQAVLGILHNAFFPEINIRFDPDNAKEMELIFDAERTREGGTLGASIYANVILCGMFLLTKKSSSRTPFHTAILLFISILIMFYAVTLSGSRYPIVIAGLLALVFFSRSLSNWRFWVAMGVFALFSLFLLMNMETVELYSIYRFDQDSGGRLDKLILPFELLTANILHLLVGASSELTANTFSLSGVGISDNSYWLLSLQFGPIYALLWFGFVVNLVKENIVNNTSFLFIVYLLVGLGITNCILWEPWVFLAILTVVVLYKQNQIGREGNFLRRQQMELT